jgi:hypothetical protein
VQLEAVCFNDICTMEIVNSLVVMVSKFSSEEQQLRNDNEALTQLRDLHQAPSPVSAVGREVASSASANNATAK